jgi:TatD DNase family protein
MATHLEADLGEFCEQLAINTERVYGSWQEGLTASA